MATALLTAYASELITGTFTLLAGLVGSILLYKQNLDTKRMEVAAQDRRTAAEFLLEKEAEGLLDLLDAAEHAYVLSQEYARGFSDDSEPDGETVEETRQAMVRFEKSLRVNRVFLSDDLEEDAESLLGAARVLIIEYEGPSYSRQGEAPKSEAWRDIHDDFETFTDSVRELITERTDDLRNVEHDETR